ncbi:SLBB domain-containing protein [Chitinophaga horti]|uniref:SLBB domain-containing protein n=1 Tax=Chitinophaga horti TaxID=2920382 RepID=A0ABY6IYH8_9BACT|nr:SLBB domain-containing protein [Chitinophaga horti]UYQ92438.1 SLBB domain-containing protein [Chitinophaga horti]
MIKKLLLLQLFVLVTLCANAQVPTMSSEAMKQMKVENLSDDQVRQVVAEMKKNKMSLDQTDSYAQQKGIPASEVQKLKQRIVALNLDKELTASGNGDNAAGQRADTRTVDEETDSRAEPMTQAELQAQQRRRRIFGAELFSNKNLSFEPNLRMATPGNYQLATGDEIMIDVYGYSEVQHRLKVTPEGYIRIPNLGPVYVNGLSMDEAKERITKQLSTIYSGIRSGNTFVSISLGNIRSIKVLLIGEVSAPATYTLPSLASVANALYVSGGPTENGSFRNIQVIRDGKVVATFDLYSFLSSGDMSNNVVLRDQDIVRVNPYSTRVELAGQVKRPAIFEAKEGETLQSILDFAGGYTDIAYRDNISVQRINNKEREVLTVPASEIGSFKLKSGDRFYVDSILNTYTNRVTISGAVHHPGDYALTQGMTLADLIRKADGVREEAALNRGLIRRLQFDRSPAYVAFDVEKVLNGAQAHALQREDSVFIFNKADLRESYQVKISGEVNKGGYFPYADSMHLEDLILLAGGLRDAASLQHVEISRRVRNATYSGSDTALAIIRQFDITSDLRTDAAGFVLQPFDEVTIRRSPIYNEQGNVYLDGEVLYPGLYTINSKTERISDVLRRAGGLRAGAYPEGAVLLRKTFVNEGDSLLLSSKLDIFYNSQADTTAVSKLENTIAKKEQLLGIQMDKILASPGSKYDLLLEEGDIIRIPKRLQTVQLFGEIYFPKKVRFDKNFSFRDYVRGAGGFTSSGLKRKSYVVYANGEVKSTKRVLFFNSYPKVKPGAEIYIPTKKEGRGLSGSEVVGLSTGLASLALVIITILDRIK